MHRLARVSAPHGSKPRPRKRTPARAHPLRFLVGCPACFRQFDAGGHAPGDALRCLCGERLVVPTPRGGEVEIVRCSSCGAPREPGARRCEFCRAPFAKAEHDRNTICSGCASRISDRARFCPACGVRIDPQGEAGVATDRPCPTCEPVERLTSRAFPDPPGSFLECRRCAGLFVGRGLFAELERRARREVTPMPLLAPRRESIATEVIYRLCPECGDRMHRKNYAARSGVVLDVCGRHGLWFDAEELERVLDWVRSGQLAFAAESERDERRAAERRRHESTATVTPLPESPLDPVPGGWLIEFLELEDVARFVAWLFRSAKQALDR